MKTQNEIKAMTLTERQQLVVDLRGIPAKDGYHATAKSLIEFITALTGWSEPVLVEVKNVAGHDITVDGKIIVKDCAGKVYPWQYSALARFLQPIEKVEAAL